MTDPVCRSPWISASARVMKFHLAAPMAAMTSGSSPYAATSGRLAGCTVPRPAAVYGSLKISSSVILQSAGLIASAASGFSCSASTPNADVPKAMSAT